MESGLRRQYARSETNKSTPAAVFELKDTDGKIGTAWVTRAGRKARTDDTHVGNPHSLSEPSEVYTSAPIPRTFYFGHKLTVY